MTTSALEKKAGANFTNLSLVEKYRESPELRKILVAARPLMIFCLSFDLDGDCDVSANLLFMLPYFSEIYITILENRFIQVRHVILTSSARSPKVQHVKSW